MKNKLYAVTNDAGETTMVIAEGLLPALDVWRAENADLRNRGNAEDTTWPISIALIHEGTILVQI